MRFHLSKESEILSSPKQAIKASLKCATVSATGAAQVKTSFSQCIVPPFALNPLMLFPFF